MSWYEIGIDDIIRKLKGTPSEPKNLAVQGIPVDRLKEYNDGYTELPVASTTPCQVFVGVPQHEAGTKNESTIRDVSTGSQDTGIYFTVSIASRELYGVTGAYTIGYKSIRWLTGLDMSIGGKLSFFKFALVANARNVWYYQLIMRLHEFPISPLEDEETEIPLETIDYDSGVCTTEIVTNLGENIIIPDENGDSILIK